MQILLDTNFIIELVKNKIDIFDIGNYGEITIPKQVIQELEKIKKEAKLEDRKNAELALKIIAINKAKLNIIHLEKKYVDLGLEKYAINHNFILASLDKNLKKKLAGRARILTLVNRKKIVLL